MLRCARKDESGQREEAVGRSGLPIESVRRLCCDGASVVIVEVHHIEHWANEGGFSIVKDYLDRWYFRRPDGQAVPDCGYCPADILQDDVNVNDASLMECPSAEVFLSKLHNTTDAEELPTLPQFVAERDPPTYLM